MYMYIVLLYINLVSLIQIEQKAKEIDQILLTSLSSYISWNLPGSKGLWQSEYHFFQGQLCQQIAQQTI